MIDVATVADGLHAGLVAGGVSHFIYLPDSVMNPLTARAEAKLGIVLLANLHQTRMNLPLSNSITM